MCRPKDIPEVAYVADKEYPGPAGPRRFRAYNAHPNASKPQPALVYIHGGGWCFDDIECHDSICRCLAKQSDVVVFSLDYRLAPEHPFPAGLEDCYAAVQWFHKSAQQLNIDPKRIAVGGDSAGGNITAALLLLTNERHGAPIALQLLMYAIVDFEPRNPSRTGFGEGYVVETTMANWVMRCYAPGHNLSDPLLSPLLADDVSFMPPTFVLTAEYDPLRDEGKLFADKLKQQGVRCNYKCYEGMIHGFLNHMYMMPFDAGAEAMADIAKILKFALHA